MKSVWLNKKTLFLTAVLGVCGAAFSNQLRFPDSSQNFLGDTKRAELSASGPITQVFTADRNGLEGFQIFMGDTDLGLGERIDFVLADPSCQKVFARTSRNIFSFPVTRDTRFIFPPLLSSANTAYCLSIEYHPGFIKKKERPYIRVAEEESYKDLSYTDHGKGKAYPGRTLQIRPLYAPEAADLPDRIEALENRLSQYKPAFMKGSMLTFGALGFLLGILFFVWIVRQKEG